MSNFLDDAARMIALAFPDQSIAIVGLEGEGAANHVA